MYGTLRRVLVRRPDEVFGSADPDVWHYRSAPDLEAARREHDAFVALLRASGAEVAYHVEPTASADAIYVHDPSIVTDAGTVSLRMGKSLRADEPPAAGRALQKAGVPLYRALEAPARAEGGDLLWLDGRTLAVGVGVRTNEDGARQIERALRPLGAAITVVPVPGSCMHLMSSVSILDRDLALVDPSLAPAELVRLLGKHGIGIVEAATTEIASMAANVLAVAPRDCIALEGNPLTRRRLTAAGCRVRTYVGREISSNAEGGPTCLTRPILRLA